MELVPLLAWLFVTEASSAPPSVPDHVVQEVFCGPINEPTAYDSKSSENNWANEDPDRKSAEAKIILFFIV
jgi:hypothetical protein